MSRLLPYRRLISVFDRRLIPVLALSVLLALSASPPAQAGSVSKILEKCARGESVDGYSQQAYREAKRQLSSLLSEYSECSELIGKAQLATAAGSHGGSSGSGSSGTGTTGGGASGRSTPVAPATPAERRSLESAHQGGSSPVHLGGGRVIHPGVVHVNIASALSSLPTPLLAILAFLLVCALTLSGGVVRNRVRARRSD